MSLRGTARVTGVEVLRLGTFNGIEVTDARLDQVVNNYDHALHRAQMTLDHIDGGAAQFGYVDQMQRVGDKIFADLENVPIWLARDMTKEGQWPTRSAQLYFDFEGKGMYLTHLSLLGVKVPAVRGMDGVTEGQIFETPYEDVTEAVAVGYATEGQEFCNFELKSDEPTTVTLAKEESMPELEKTVDLAEQNAKLEADNKAKDEKIANLTQEQTERNVQLVEDGKERDTKLTELTEYKRRTEATDFIKTKLKGKATPGMLKAGLVDVIMLAQDTKGMVNLESGEATFYDTLMTVFEAMPDLPTDTELAPEADDEKPKAKVSEGTLELADNLGVSQEDIEKYGGGG